MWYIYSNLKRLTALKDSSVVPWFSPLHTVCLLNLGKCGGILYRVKCHRFNLTPLEPGSLLIGTYRDVAAEHHKGAAYQHRCYLVCLFHRGVRTPPYTDTHTPPPPPPLDRDQGHLHWVKHGSTRPAFSSSVCHLLNTYQD